ncbi:hypothetical protein PR048_001555 [Dryococelus australis]|uniref:Uncharacterized protein n=1 Tax=Dryococelus australis TaxID=614101 RepID=A0ABQ9IIE1_9NEOP|nr:hypothetical protein PR048_001555 [Dryococelus australis]
MHYVHVDRSGGSASAIRDISGSKLFRNGRGLDTDHSSLLDCLPAIASSSAQQIAVLYLGAWEHLISTSEGLPPLVVSTSEGLPSGRQHMILRRVSSPRTSLYYSLYDAWCPDPLSATYPKDTRTKCQPVWAPGVGRGSNNKEGKVVNSAAGFCGKNYSSVTLTPPLATHQGELGSIPSWFTPDFRNWESCRVMPLANRVQSLAGSLDFGKWELCWTMSLVGGFSRGSPISPTPSLRRHLLFTFIALIGSEDLAVKNRPNLFTRALTYCSSLILLTTYYIFSS